MKKALKEIAIFILLCLAVTLVLAILFYNFNPSGKVVPSKVTYTVPEAIKEELQEATEKSETSIKVEDKIYTIEGTDLNVYKKNRSYDSGKTNPFETIQTESTASGTDTTTKTVINGSTKSTNTTTPEAMNETKINSNLTNSSSTSNTKTNNATRIK